MCQTFLPQLINTGRIVSLSSVASNIDIYNQMMQNRFRSAATLEDLEQIAQEFEVSKAYKVPLKIDIITRNNMTQHRKNNHNRSRTLRVSQNSVRTSTEESSGFGSAQRSYNVSKALLRAATRILSDQNRKEHPDSQVLINCCCPGWVDTDMGGIVSRRGTRPPKTPEEGGRIPVRLALDDIGGVTGEHFSNDSVRSRDEGKVQKW